MLFDLVLIRILRFLELSRRADAMKFILSDGILLVCDEDLWS